MMVIERRSALGDVVLLSAVTGTLPEPVWIATSPRYHGLVRKMSNVAGVLEPGRPKGFEGVWIDLHGGRGSPLRKRSLRRRLRLFSDAVGPRPHVSQLYASALGTTVASRPWIVAQGPTKRTLTVAIVAGSHRVKQAPVSLLRQALVHAPGRKVVVCGLNTQKQAKELANQLGAELVFERDVARLVPLFHQTRVAVGPDTGLVHLAGACGARLVSLFGPTHPDDGFACHGGAIVQRHDVRCRPCVLGKARWCWRGDLRCWHLSPQAIAEQVSNSWRLPCVGSC